MSRTGASLRAWVVAATVSSFLVGMVGPVVPPAGADSVTAPPVRIALLGDSITHGTAGDYTWRYFAWKHLVADGVNADFVGPENDLWEHSLAYADPGFDRDHAAHYGDAYAWLSHPVPQLMAAYDPDVLVILLGLNDLTFAQLTPQQVLDETRTAVDQARAANPHVALVVSRLTATWIAGVDTFNSLLSSAAPTWSTDTSPVVVADSDAGFTESTSAEVHDTWDQVHPDAVGDQKIAAAVSDALARLGVGQAYPRPLVAPPLGPRTPALLSGVPGDASADLTWTSPPGATTERVWVQDLTEGTPSTRVAEAAGTSVHLTGLVNGHDYDISLQAVKGFVPAEGVRSDVVRLRPREAVPGTVGGLLVRSSDHGARLAWRGAAGATSYRVWRRNLSAHGGWATSSVTTTTASLGGLEAGARYEVRVQGLAAGGAGPLSSPAYAVPLGPVVAAPRWAGVRARRSGLVTLRWHPVARATAYAVLRRDVTHRGAWRLLVTGRPPTATWLRLGGQRRGVTYAFEVRALHQRVVGGTSAARRVRIPR